MNDTPAPSPFRLLLRKLVFVGGALLVLWLVLAQLAPRLMNAGVPETPAEEQAEAPVVQDSALETRIRALEEKIVSVAAPQPDVDLRARVEALEGQLAAKSNAPTLDASAFQALQQQVATLQQQFTSQQSSAVRTGALQALYRLREEVRQGSTFTVTLAQLREATSGREGVQEPLTALEQDAADGVPTLSTLQTEFAPLIRTALKTHEKSISGSLGSLVTIRRIGGDQQGTNDEAVLARAEAKLMRGALADALSELEAASPATQSTLQPWREKAARGVAAQKALAQLETVLLAP